MACTARTGRLCLWLDFWRFVVDTKHVSAVARMLQARIAGNMFWQPRCNIALSACKPELRAVTVMSYNPEDKDN